ncbi:M50 family metallopeptidase [Kordia sp. YSTF-M3]|uniref:M50 family metallopeptidase n=1 Tax=Kordia aestuariivivens TaxID=2759037 RepID=A0ABR7Q944_9FLAO|nr:tetratricopeptide repeat protein [Kordia aestuariivivens]MBC8755058.1 M50 family metallopeptidase [Kordia aestuariivivens]
MRQEYTIVLIISLLVFRRLVIVIHEFGHAIATLLNSDDRVTVYIGSYGNPEKSFRFQMKRLECFIKYNVFTWKGGVCVPHGKNISWKGSFLISLFGPLTTFFIACIAGASLLFFEKYSVWNVIFFALAFTCFLDFAYNIIPRKTPIQLHDGTFTNNDGKSLLHLWKLKPIYELYKEATAYYTDKEYVKAAELFEKCNKILPKDRELNRTTITSFLAAKKYAKAIELQEVYSKNYKDSYDVHDHVNIGVIEIHHKNYANALDSFEKALAINPKHAHILNNRGYALGLLDRHEEAIIDLNKAISLDETFSYAWDNRGLSKIMLGQLEDGFEDLQKSIALDDQNSYVYRNLGIYHFQKKEYSKAFGFYQKALELDPETHEIQEYIDEVQAKLNS